MPLCPLSTPIRFRVSQAGGRLLSPTSSSAFPLTTKPTTTTTHSPHTPHTPAIISLLATVLFNSTALPLSNSLSTALFSSSRRNIPPPSKQSLLCYISSLPQVGHTSVGFAVAVAVTVGSSPGAIPNKP